MGAYDTISVAFAPVLGWLVIVAGLAMGIAVAVWAVQLGWSLVTFFVGSAVGGSGEWWDHDESSDCDCDHCSDRRRWRAEDDRANREGF